MGRKGVSVLNDGHMAGILLESSKRLPQPASPNLALDAVGGKTHPSPRPEQTSPANNFGRPMAEVSINSSRGGCTRNCVSNCNSMFIEIYVILLQMT